MAHYEEQTYSIVVLKVSSRQPMDQMRVTRELQKHFDKGQGQYVSLTLSLSSISNLSISIDSLNIVILCVCLCYHIHLVSMCDCCARREEFEVEERC